MPRAARGPGSQKFAQAVAREIVAGNQDDRLRGATRYGTAVARLRRPRRKPYLGMGGPPLAPQGAGSRVITNFRAKESRTSSGYVITAGWNNVVGRNGFHFLPAHDMGAGHSAPAPPIFGVGPRNLGGDWET